MGKVLAAPLPRMVSSWLIAIPAIVLVLSGCRSPRAQSTPPPPRGQSLESYLAGDAGPKAQEVEEAEQKPPESVTLHVIDIGQGAAAIVEFPCGAVLIDTGGEKNDEFDSWRALREYIDAFFDRRGDLERTFELLVVTHPHIDHTRNLEAVLERYRVRNVVDNGARSGDIGIEPQNAMHEWLDAREGAVGHHDVLASSIEPPGLTNPVIDPIGGCGRSPIDPKLTALWGGKKKREPGSDPNNRSVVLRVDFAEASFLLAGDLERLAIAQMTKRFKDREDVLDADVYLVPHHGSRNSTAEHLVSAVSPKVAVISAGPYHRDQDWTARRFGHPHRDSIEDLLDEEHGVTMLRDKPAEVMVGLRGAWKETPSEFEKRTIERAIYTTGWDGSVRVTALPSGELQVHTGL